MFNYYDIGKKIKTIARIFAIVYFVILCIASAAVFWISIGSGSLLFFFGSILLFPCAYIVSWWSGVSMYAFGEIVDNIIEIRKTMEQRNL